MIGRWIGGRSRSALLLLAGTVLGQAFSVLAAPLLTRLFTPEQFGVLATFSALLMLGLSFTSLRYNVALSSGVSDAESFQLLRLCLRVMVVTTAVVGLGAWVMNEFAGERLVLGDIWWALPLGFAGLGAFDILCSEASRQRRYGDLAVTKIWQGLTGPLSQIALGLAGAGAVGLVIGYLAGQMAGVVRLYRALLPAHGGRGVPAFASLRALASKYREHPQFSSWAGMLGSASQGHLLVLAMGAFYGPQYAGYCLLVDRIVGRPLLMVSSSLLHVFLGELAAIRRDGGEPLSGLFAGTLAKQLAVSLPWVALCAFAAPWVVGPIFGAAWVDAAPLIQVLALAFVPQAAVHAVAYTLQSLGRPQHYAAWALTYNLVVGGALWLAHRHGASVMQCLQLFVVLQWASHGVLLVLMWRAVRGAPKVLEAS